MISSERKKVCKHPTLEEFATFFGSVSHTTTTKIKAAQNNMPFEGPGRGLVNPNIHSDPSKSKVAYQSVTNHSYK